MVKIILDVEGMACPMCEAHVNEAIRNAFSVKTVTSSHEKKRTEIIADGALDEEKLKKTVEATGYQVRAVSTEPCA